MPSPERLLVLLRQAAVLLRAMPGRRGRVVRLEHADELLIAGDLHGHLANFQKIVQLADLPRHPRRHLVLQELIHGPFRYPDGSDQSHQLLDRFAALIAQFPKQVHYLLGNHELAQWTQRPILKGDENYNALFESGVHTAYGPQWGPQVYQAYVELFAALPVMIRTPNRLLVSHSLPAARDLEQWQPARLEQAAADPAELAPRGSIHALVWGRDTRPEHVARFLHIADADLLISGHIPAPNGFHLPNPQQIILDCAAEPAACLLVPVHTPVHHADLVQATRIL